MFLLMFFFFFFVRVCSISSLPVWGELDLYAAHTINPETMRASAE